VGIYPVLPTHLVRQLGVVPPSRDGDLEYRPCAVTVDDGSEIECVYVVDYEAYLRHWGVRPEDDPGKLWVPLERVRALRESSYRLPAALADELYQAGESGMGYTVFTVEFADGTRQAYVGGNAIDFINPPGGLNAADARRVCPHEGRQETPRRVLPYHWCSLRWQSKGPANFRMQLIRCGESSSIWMGSCPS
jgi:hypothetical protein